MDATASKARSCAVCRSRKVRCDKLSPCTNCSRANIPCVLPRTDTIPRWARRLDRAAIPPQSQPPQSPGPPTQILDRLRNLENLVKDLRQELYQAHTTSSAPPATQPDTHSPHVQLGRLAVDDAHSGRYVSSGFWSRIKDEVDSLEMDTSTPDKVTNQSESSDQDYLAEHGLGLPTCELDRTPSDRNAFMFRHNLNPAVPNPNDFHPLPSQIPFLIDVYHDNVNMFIQAAHIPTIHNMVRDLRNQGTSSLSPSNEALLFSIYYASVNSMEHDDVMANFDTTRNDLITRFRLGLEHALANADFLNSPNLTLVQALVIFLFLARRHDSPRYVWMMTGVAIRMARALGLHRDGAGFAHLTPFEIEMRRRVWWALYALELRAAEDQGTDMDITDGSFDTKRPLSINDSDIGPYTENLPQERTGYTDMTIPEIYVNTGQAAARLLSIEIEDGIPDIEHHGRLVVESYELLGRYGAQIGNVKYRVGMIIAQIVIAKITLVLYLPVVATLADQARAKEIGDKLFASAIELAERNHELNDERAFSQWRWMFQTYTQWHAIVSILRELCRRPWGPISERAWVALRSPWLIPRYPRHAEKNNQVLVPLSKLMNKTRQHRMDEVQRLLADPGAVKVLEVQDSQMPQPKSNGINVLQGADIADHYLTIWRRLVSPGRSDVNLGIDSSLGETRTNETRTDSASNLSKSQPMTTVQPAVSKAASYRDIYMMKSADLGSYNFNAGMQSYPGPVADRDSVPNRAGTAEEPAADTDTYLPFDLNIWYDGRNMTTGLDSWLWVGMDTGNAGPMNDFSAVSSEAELDLESVNWFGLVQSAQGMDWDSGPQPGGL